MSFMRKQTIAADRYVQAPISRIPSGDLASSGMSFMSGGAMRTGALGADPATYAPRGGAMRRYRQSRAMRGKGSCTGSGHCHCMKGGGLYA
jgi:hypothetical protein